MNLSKGNAMQIVTEISDIISQNVNMMDENGIIIASTDPGRLYNFHGGAAHVIQNGLSELIITSDNEYEGTRKGINLPVELSGNIVGVIGLTGEYDEVVKYGQIIKKMTEILVRENSTAQQKKLDVRIRNRFMDDWVLEGLPLTPDFIERGKRLGIDVTIPYRIMVSEMANLAQYSDTASGQIIIDKVNSFARKTVGEILGGLFTKTTSRMIILLPASYYSAGRLVQFAEKLQESVKTEFDVNVLIGIDEQCESANAAYQRAVKALNACNTKRGRTICQYANINLELLTSEVSAKAKRNFVQRIFHPIAYGELSTWIHLLETYYRHNCSISKASEELFLHKNTLQYRLSKLHELTGLDPRYINDAMLFILAIELYIDLQK